MRWLKKLDDFLLAGLLVAFADGVLFHAGAYFPLLRPESHSGEVARHERRLARSIAAHPGRDRIVVMGNSVSVAAIQEGQLEAELNAAGLPFHAVNMAAPSTAPRSWLLLLTGGGVTANNTSTVVLGLHPGTILASPNDQVPRDLHISKTHLKLTDAWTVAATYSHREMRLMAFSSAFFRSPLFRDDVRSYLENSRKRHRQLRARATQEASGDRRENRSRDDLTSARLGDDGRIVFDELADFLRRRDRLRRGVERRLQRHRQFLASGGGGGSPPAVAEKLKTLSRLVERLNGEGIRVVFSVVPRSPYPLGALDATGIEAFCDSLRRRGADVALWHDAALIEELESPRFYRELVHVNAEGARFYTQGLARFLAGILEKPKSRAPTMGGPTIQN